MTNSNKDSRLERALRFLIALVVALSLVIPMVSPGVFAASSLSLSGGDNVKGGETFTVAVTFSGGNVGRVDAQLTYDTDQLTYISGGTSKGNTGYIQLKSAGTEGAIVFNIKFQAIKSGSAVINVTTNEMYDLDEMMMDTPSASKTINIEGDASEEELITEPPDEDLPEEETSLQGVDEMTDPTEVVEEDVEGASSGNITRIIIASCAIVVILIVIISVALGKTGKRKKW